MKSTIFAVLALVCTAFFITSVRASQEELQIYLVNHRFCFDDVFYVDNKDNKEVSFREQLGEQSVANLTANGYGNGFYKGYIATPGEMQFFSTPYFIQNNRIKLFRSYDVKNTSGMFRDALQVSYQGEPTIIKTVPVPFFNALEQRKQKAQRNLYHSCFYIGAFGLTLACFIYALYKNPSTLNYFINKN